MYGPWEPSTLEASQFPGVYPVPMTPTRPTLDELEELQARREGRIAPGVPWNASTRNTSAQFSTPFGWQTVMSGGVEYTPEDRQRMRMGTPYPGMMRTERDGPRMTIGATAARQAHTVGPGS